MDGIVKEQTSFVGPKIVRLFDDVQGVVNIIYTDNHSILLLEGICEEQETEEARNTTIQIGSEIHRVASIIGSGNWVDIAWNEQEALQILVVWGSNLTAASEVSLNVEVFEEIQEVVLR